jgi:hypothetical protein
MKHFTYLALLVILSGCAAKPYATIALGYQLDDHSDYWVRTVRDYQCDTNVQFNGEIGLEFDNNLTVGYHHQSWVFCGGPLNNKPELYQDDIRITKKFGGYK